MRAINQPYHGRLRVSHAASSHVAPHCLFEACCYREARCVKTRILNDRLTAGMRPLPGPTSRVQFDGMAQPRRCRVAYSPPIIASIGRFHLGLLKSRHLLTQGPELQAEFVEHRLQAL